MNTERLDRIAGLLIAAAVGLLALVLLAGFYARFWLGRETPLMLVVEYTSLSIVGLIIIGVCAKLLTTVFMLREARRLESFRRTLRKIMHAKQQHPLT